MAIVTLGIDLAKNGFALHGVNEAGKPVLLIAALPVSALRTHRPAYRPKFVAPYRRFGKRGKNDAADAAAICEAVQRPNMRFVPIKSVDQQGRLMVHRARQGFVDQRTAIINRIRGLLAEVGIVLPLKAATVRLTGATRHGTWPARRMIDSERRAGHVPCRGASG